ncbi:uncharacterized protein UTRI_00355 [Ustilago trichophora]|uniref:Uncharacterized protein n=1 Tax=Ustilago trichophora TaxID=86804 RepID=A0A5C3DRF0_9BASI|nr:uncharacterized protein UTRI_00355 [Ustilago trichophora]
MLSQEHTAGTSRASTPLSNSAEIVTARKISRKVAQAAPITHYRGHSKSNSVELRKHTQSKEAHEPTATTSVGAVAVTAAAAGGSPRIMPSPVPPPTSALPPTPGGMGGQNVSPTLGSAYGLTYRGSTGSSFAASGLLARSIRKTFRHLGAGLTVEEHTELVQKILTDLRPALPSTTVRPFSRASRPNSLVASSSPSKMTTTIAKPEPVEEIADPTAATEKRLSASSQGTTSSSIGSHCSQASDEKLGMSQISTSASDFSTPQLSQSRTPTPTTPASPMSRTNTDDKIKGNETINKVAATREKALLTPTDALESLRVLENGFERSGPNSPLDATFATNDSNLSQSTAVASPITAVVGEKESQVRSSNTSGTVSPPRQHKRDSSYRKSVPTLEELTNGKKGLGISQQQKDTASSAASSVRASSPLSTYTETPSWISSLTTLEAIRVLAFQQSVDTATTTPKSPTIPIATSTATATAAAADEVSALRYALTFTLARADKLAEALNRVSEDKIKVETELEILRRNVLSMLGSKNMFSGVAPQSASSSSSHGNYESIVGRHGAVDSDNVQEEDLDHFVDAHSRQTPVSTYHNASRNEAQTARRGDAVSRPPRATRAAKSVATSSPPAKPSGGVSIASLRKNNPSIATSPAVTQRYTPSTRHAGQSVEDDADFTDEDEEEEEEEDEDDDEFNMYPFGPPIRRGPAPQVSMTDFLNASRMSKSEIEEHDARREKEYRGHSDEADRFYSASSTSSHAPLAGGGSMRSLDSHRRGFFKGITKLVDQERAKRTKRRTSLASKPSMVSLVPSNSLSRDSSLVAGRRSASTTNIIRNMPSHKNFNLTYEEESIIPSYPNSAARLSDRRQKTMSMSNSLRESLEKQSLREAGTRQDQKAGVGRKWGGDSFSGPSI